MSINYDEYVGRSALTWEQVYEAFKARLAEDLVARPGIWAHSDNGIGFCSVCGQELTTAHDHACPALGAL